MPKPVLQGDRCVGIFRADHDSIIESVSPLDVLYHENPEVASLVYANKHNLLSPDILPYIANYRAMQHEEKLQCMREITNRLGIEADWRKYEKGVDGNIRQRDMIEHGQSERITTEQNQATERMKIHENSLTERVRIENNSNSDIAKLAILEESNRSKISHESSIRHAEIVNEGLTERTKHDREAYSDIMKTKYAFNRHIIQEHINGQKYISDNELKALSVEAESQKEIIVFTESIRHGTLLQLSNDELEAKIKAAELKYTKSIQEAEVIRDTIFDSNRKEIVNCYVTEQSKIIRAMFAQEIELKALETKKVMKGYESVDNAVAMAAKLLMERKDLDSITINASNGHCELFITIDGKKKES